MSKPKRIRLSRKKGWRLPAGTVNVARPGRWGNGYSVDKYGRELAVIYHRRKLEAQIAICGLDLSELRGKDVACWCKPDELCHGDTLLELANLPEGEG